MPTLGPFEAVVLVVMIGIPAAVTGVVLRRIPRVYEPHEWRAVRGGWWVQAALVLILGLYSGGIYPLVIFTIWQRADPEPLPKRLVTALGMTILLFDPLCWIAVVPWSRNQYFLYQCKSLNDLRMDRAALRTQ